MPSYHILILYTILKSAIIVKKSFYFSESRPARKEYNKLSGDEQTTKKSSEFLDNENACNKNSTDCVGGNSLDSDTDSSFTEIDMDDRDDFSDDSDYGECAYRSFFFYLYPTCCLR